MPRAYSNDLRARVLRACEAGESQAWVARRFQVSEACVSTWRKQAHTEGRRSAKPHGGGPVMLAGDLALLDRLAAEHTDASLAEYAALIAARTGRRHSPPALCRALRRLGWRRKKRPSRPANRRARTCRRRARLGARSSATGRPAI